MTFALWQQSSHLRWTWVLWKAFLHCQWDKSLVNRTSGSICYSNSHVNVYLSMYAYITLHRRQKRLRECIPRGYALVQSTGDGNCLFNSVSIGLIGDESLGTSLRLMAVLHAVQHFDHYMEAVSFACILSSWHLIHCNYPLTQSQICPQLEDTGMAIQFLASVSTDEAFQNRPKMFPTKEELGCYTLQQETMQTSKLNSFSG